ncbi:hypothetical protein [Streptomyces sp. NPDC050485]|uniref:hypothetical protein n=1 Tax=Streptomyces sp. NPDC050485 TaxID=3365617 RepID=UPI0037874374
MDSIQRAQARLGQCADDHTLAYPEPAPHPLWSRTARPWCSPLTRAEQQHNQELLLDALRTDRTARPQAEAS